MGAGIRSAFPGLSWKQSQAAGLVQRPAGSVHGDPRVSLMCGHSSALLTARGAVLGTPAADGWGCSWCGPQTARLWPWLLPSGVLPERHPTSHGEQRSPAWPCVLSGHWSPASFRTLWWEHKAIPLWPELAFSPDQHCCTLSMHGLTWPPRLPSSGMAGQATEAPPRIGRSPQYHDNSPLVTCCRFLNFPLLLQVKASDRGDSHVEFSGAGAWSA